MGIFPSKPMTIRKYHCIVDDQLPLFVDWVYDDDRHERNISNLYFELKQLLKDFHFHEQYLATLTIAIVAYLRSIQNDSSLTTDNQKVKFDHYMQHLLLVLYDHQLNGFYDDPESRIFWTYPVFI
jgi:hypothetical protein